MAGTGRIYRRGDIYYIAYRWDGREYRESARSAQRGVAEHLLATRLRERRGSPPPADLTFDALAAWYLDDYIVRHLRTLDTARGRVANLRAVFGGWPATAITTEAIRDYQRRRRLVAAAAATVNRETSALSRMFHLTVRSRQLDERPVFPERLEENGPRQGFFEHAEYTAVRQQLPAPYQDVLDFAYYSGWRKSGRFWTSGGTRWTSRAGWCGFRRNGRRRGWAACCRSRRRLRRCWPGGGRPGGWGRCRSFTATP